MKRKQKFHKTVRLPRQSYYSRWEKPADENLVAVSIVTVRLRYERYYTELQPSSVLYFEEATTALSQQIVNPINPPLA